MTTDASTVQGVRVPFVDLGPSHSEIRDELLTEIGDLVDSGRFTNGPQVAAFEQAFARYCGAAHCVGLASGLDALRLALIAAELEQGDEVIVPGSTFVATFEAVSQAGGRPVPVDVGEDDYNLDPDRVEQALTPRTRFLMPVHLYGQLADMNRLRAVADSHGIEVIEDACQAHGATRDGIGPGELALAAAFSFYPGKNLGAFGDAGALVTGDPRLAEEVRALREHGQSEKYKHRLVGFTSRLDTLQALVLARKLTRLDDWTADRRAAAGWYSSELAGVGDLRVPPVPEGSEPVWHLYVVRTHDPAALATFLGERGIATGRHYPEPPHLSEAYASLGLAPGSLPVSEALSAEALSLPIFPGITEEQLGAVAGAVRDFFDGG
jgi:dTDP-4-amino-4,6-dideoxygalactose transaminase